MKVRIGFIAILILPLAGLDACLAVDSNSNDFSQTLTPTVTMTNTSIPTFAPTIATTFTPIPILSGDLTIVCGDVKMQNTTSTDYVFFLLSESHRTTGGIQATLPVQAGQLVLGDQVVISKIDTTLNRAVLPSDGLDMTTLCIPYYSDLHTGNIFGIQITYGSLVKGRVSEQNVNFYLQWAGYGVLSDPVRVQAVRDTGSGTDSSNDGENNDNGGTNPNPLPVPTSCGEDGCGGSQ